MARGIEDSGTALNVTTPETISSPWMTEKEGAAYIGISTRMIRDRAKKKLVPAHEIPCPGRNRIFRFRREELDACLMGEWRPGKSNRART